MTGGGRQSQKISRVSLRTLTALMTAGLVATSVVAVSQSSERNLRRTLTAEAETHLLLEARNLAALSTDALLSDFPELTLVPLVREIERSRAELEGIVVVDHAGLIKGHADPHLIGDAWTPVDGAGESAYREFLNPDETLTLAPTRIHAYTPVRHHSEGTLGGVAIELDRSHIEARIRAARRPLLLVAAAAIIVSIVLMTGLLSVLFKPVGAIAEGLVRIGKGDLGTPLPVRGPAELGRLADTLNTMTAQLKASRALAQAREEEIIETQREVITTLGDVVESRSRETANHTRRVGAMSKELAKLAGLNDYEAELLRLASPMHDVGKIGIPDSILNKPGPLTEGERKVMETHAIIGYEILKGSKRAIMQAAAIIARDHHERWDGCGYPHGIGGEEIHVFGRITALVDVFDALASDRVYRPAMPLDKVLGIIEEGRGSHFEPRLVDIFMTNLNLFLAIRERFADTPEDKPVVPDVEEFVDLLSELTDDVSGISGVSGVEEPLEV